LTYDDTIRSVLAASDGLTRGARCSQRAREVSRDSKRASGSINVGVIIAIERSEPSASSRRS
jgi:hypothetical protein